MLSSNIIHFITFRLIIVCGSFLENSVHAKFFLSLESLEKTPSEHVIFYPGPSKPVDQLNLTFLNRYFSQARQPRCINYPSVIFSLYAVLY